MTMIGQVTICNKIQVYEQKLGKEQSKEKIVDLKMW